jgi:hypothetical protein
MGINEAGGDELLSVIMQPCLRVPGAQGVCLAHGSDASAVYCDSAIGDGSGGVKPVAERVADIAQHLAQK